MRPQIQFFRIFCFWLPGRVGGRATQFHITVSGWPLRGHFFPQKLPECLQEARAPPRLDCEGRWPSMAHFFSLVLILVPTLAEQDRGHKNAKSTWAASTSHAGENCSDQFSKTTLCKIDGIGRSLPITNYTDGPKLQRLMTRKHAETKLPRQFFFAAAAANGQVDFAFLRPLSCPGRDSTKKRTKEKKSAANGQART